MPLNPDQIDKLRLTLAASGWNDVMKPAIINRGKTAVKALVLTKAEREREFKDTDFATDDDVLRAVIRDCEWMASVWDNEVRVADFNRKRDELDASNNNYPANPAS